MDMMRLVGPLNLVFARHGTLNAHQAKDKQQAAKSGGGGSKNKAEEAERRLELIREIEKVNLIDWFAGYYTYSEPH